LIEDNPDGDNDDGMGHDTGGSRNPDEDAFEEIDLQSMETIDKWLQDFYNDFSLRTISLMKHQTT
jgi:hypothetical protein